MQFRRRGPPPIKPVKPGDELEVTIEAIGSRGDGIARVNKFVIFVPGTSVGEKVKIRVKDVFARAATAEKI